MSTYLKRKEKRRLPTMEARDPQRAPSPDDGVRMGRVEIDNDLCNGCKLCVQACPAQVLEMSGKTSVRMIGDSAACIACGDCLPICLPDAITLVGFMEYEGLYKFIGRDQPSPPRTF